MADDTRDAAAIIPDALHVQETTFPYPRNNTSTSSTLKPSATDGGAPENVSEKDHAQFDSDDVARQTSTPAPGPRASPDITAPRQSMQRSATDRPRPMARRSLLGRKRAQTQRAAPQLQRQPTVTFDDYFSDSLSSDDDESRPSTPSKTTTTETNDSKRHVKEPRPFSSFKIKHEHFDTKGKVSKLDGRLKLSIHETVNSGYFAKTLGAGLKKHLRGDSDVASAKSGIEGDLHVDKIPPEEDDMEDPKKRIRLNIVVIVIGSRGDIQPFLKIGKILKEDYGHRVRIATHPVFKKFVEEDSGLEFFSVGGDPSELMAFMVKNPGLIPGVQTIMDGEIGKRRSAMYDMFQGMWRACINSTDDESDQANLKMMGDKQPFIADAIIANPPSFAPPHIAERLGIPLHMMFTFPYTPTVQFPHPLANIKASNVDAHYSNFMSYPLVEMMTWQGLGDLINRFRGKTLGLEEVSTLWAPGQLYRLKVPYTYMWSPSLVPKPKDWGPEIDIGGFVFLDLASTFKPPDDLVEFLEAGPPPIYIGFGSIVVDDPDKFTKLIFEAIEMAGVRALVSKGWGGFGSNDSTPDNIFMLENTPHDWLFPKVSAVIHHGGAGTTAIGLKCGKPTMIVPFFGDQPWWGAMVSKAKAGAHECIPYKKLTVERLAEGIKQCLTDEAKENAQKMASNIEKEGDGALNAVRSFHRSLPLRGDNNMRCQFIENRVATWKLKDTDVRLSPLAAELLVEWNKIKWNDLRLLRHSEWNDFGGPGEPLTGAWSATLNVWRDMFTGVGLAPVKMAKSVKKHEQYYEKKARLRWRKKHGKAVPKRKPSKDARKDNQNARPTQQREESYLGAAPQDYLAEELAEEAGHGLRKTFGAILRSPMTISVAVAQGFHNAPRLYGDETVRRPHRITGFHSGLRAGRDEFVYGVADGVSGLAMQPVRGAKKGGVLGALQGVGMGVGGFVLKDIAALIGPPAYFLKGCDEEYKKKYQPTNFIRRARIIQGQKDVKALRQGIALPPRSAEREAEAAKSEVERENELRRVEKQVESAWKASERRILEERKRHKHGLRAALLGRSRPKEGVPVLRKETMGEGQNREEGGRRQKLDVVCCFG